MDQAHAKIVYEVPAHRALRRLYALRSNVLCVTGVGQFLVSLDRGSSWKERETAFGNQFILALAECEDVVLLFLETESKIEVWSGNWGEDGWEQVSWLPLSSCLDVGVLEDNTVVVALKKGDYLHIYASDNAGKTWRPRLELPFPGTLTHFGLNSLGVGITIMLDTRDTPEGLTFESTIVTTDVMSGRIKATQTVRANIQSACRVQESSWLLGADYGTLFSYELDTESLTTKMVFEDDQLNISAIDVAVGKACLIAETSDPPTEVFVIRQGADDEWISQRTNVPSYVWGSKQVSDGIVCLTETKMYKISIDVTAL
jgi:hypothetical protein